jgi:hypothetical protein
MFKDAATNLNAQVHVFHVDGYTEHLALST